MKITVTKIMFTVLSLALYLAMSGAAHAICPNPFEVQGGIIDEFALPEDPATPLGNLIGFGGTGFPGGNFDETDPATTVAHTFTGFPIPVCEAELEFRVELRDTLGADTLYLGLEEQFPGFHNPPYRMEIGSIPSNPNWGIVGDRATIVLDLANLPVSNQGVSSVMDQLSDGSFDFAVGLASKVDYAILRVCECPTTGTEKVSWTDVKELFR